MTSAGICRHVRDLSPSATVYVSHVLLRCENRFDGSLTQHFICHWNRDVEALNWEIEALVYSWVQPVRHSQFYDVHDIIRTYVLTEVHEDWTKNVQNDDLLTLASFNLSRDVIEAIFLTKFHEDWPMNVANRALTKFHCSHIKKTAPPPGGHFNEDWTIIVTSKDGQKVITIAHHEHGVLR
ncbi:hypothetical protein DPMN_143418 [Dreissena polymorpha]|uniref:Uncharacterized protein n=1 Tax=Dreissena polymorpha TaxID=45954 RepID=A0A9D4GG67_DREPO|nr:hypothetical protein DPMN_143418 [Dreissena polymorpha]